MSEVWTPTEQYSEHGKILRCLKIMEMLKSRWMTCLEIAEATDCSPRTAIRYLKTLHEAGFVILKRGDEYKIEHL